MKPNRFGSAMTENDNDSDAGDNQEPDNNLPHNSDAPVYVFEGYDVEINAKVALMPKANQKV